LSVQVAERTQAALGQAAARALQAQLDGEWRAFKSLRRRLATPHVTSPPDYAPAGGSPAAAAATPAAPRSILKRAPAPDAPEPAEGRGGIDDDSSAELLALPDLAPQPELRQAAAREGSASAAPAAAPAAKTVRQQEDHGRLTPRRGSGGQLKANEAATPQALSISSNGIESICMPIVTA
jgi:hypothetical protein